MGTNQAAAVVVENWVSINLCAPAHHPTAQTWVPPGYTLTGGGAQDLWQGGQGNLLTASYPIQRPGDTVYTGWAAAGKDQFIPDKAALAVYAIGIKITYNGAPVTILQQVTSLDSPIAEHPSARVQVPSGWIGTCGGAMDNYGTGQGNLLIGSYPILNSNSTSIRFWQASGKDHFAKDSCSITAFVVSIQIQNPPGANLTSGILAARAQSAAANWPSASVDVPTGYALVGGGAADGGWQGAGNLLTASYPVIDTNGMAIGWAGAGKDQLSSDSGVVTTFAIGLMVSATIG